MATARRPAAAGLGRVARALSRGPPRPLAAAPADVLPLAAPPPGPGATTIDAVRNPSGGGLSVRQVFSDPTGFRYGFWSPVPGGATRTYHVSTIPQIPGPFRGRVTLAVGRPLRARVVGDDDFTPTGTPSATPPAAGTPTR